MERFPFAFILKLKIHLFGNFAAFVNANNDDDSCDASLGVEEVQLDLFERNS